MDQALEDAIDLKLERAFRSFTNNALKGEGGLCGMQHKILGQEIKKCVGEKIEESMTEQKNDQISFYRKLLLSGVLGLICLFIGQIIIKSYF